MHLAREAEVETAGAASAKHHRADKCGKSPWQARQRMKHSLEHTCLETWT